MYSQEPSKRRINELKEAWHKEAQELSDLGKKIIEKEDILKNLHNAEETFLEELSINTRVDKNIARQKAYSIAKNFTYNLRLAIKNNANINEFFINELIKNIGNGIINKENFPMQYDKIKFITLMINIETTLLHDLIIACGEKVKKLAELEKELSLLGYID
jgi:hypothetical protein